MMDARLEKIQVRRERIVREARSNFYKFCKTLAPDFYQDHRTHLFILCDTLQKLYQGKLIREDGKAYRKLRIHIFPQSGKSRTLILFCMWAFGQNKHERIITCSYNDVKAVEFSKYTRDDMSRERINAVDICYLDLFPSNIIKYGDASKQLWALEGEHFSYKGAGVAGTLTGSGGTIRIIDDSVKDVSVAYNESALDKIWEWYTGTFLSRASTDPIDIICQTRWKNKDIIGRILDDEIEAKEWHNLTFEAYDEKTDTFLCEDFLSRDRYFNLRRQMDPAIFMANYHQQTIDIQGQLYSNFKTYKDIPVSSEGKTVWDRIIAYCDTADEGSDFLCLVIAGRIKDMLYVLDIYYTDAAMEITETSTAKILAVNAVNEILIESNSGGRGFARAVERILKSDYHKHRCVVKWFHQGANKQSRILSNAPYFQEHVLFPIQWHAKWPVFYKALTEYSKSGKNKHDDAPDACTGLVEMMTLGPKKARSVSSLY